MIVIALPGHDILNGYSTHLKESNVSGDHITLLQLNDVAHNDVGEGDDDGAASTNDSRVCGASEVSDRRHLALGLPFLYNRHARVEQDDEHDDHGFDVLFNHQREDKHSTYDGDMHRGSELRVWVGMGVCISEGEK